MRSTRDSSGFVSLAVGHSVVKSAPYVVVVGAGVIGCSVAYELARRGGRVHVIDRRGVGQGATQASAGVLAPYISAHAESQLLRLGARSLDLYDEFVSRVVEDSGASVQYVRGGTLEVTLDGEGARRLQDVARGYREMGVAAEYLDQQAAHSAEPQLAETVVGGLLVGTHGFVGASDLTNALRRAARAYGVTFSSSTSAVRISGHEGVMRVETSSEAVACDVIVMAAGSWSSQVEADGGGGPSGPADSWATSSPRMVEIATQPSHLDRPMLRGSVDGRFGADRCDSRGCRLR